MNLNENRYTFWNKKNFLLTTSAILGAVAVIAEVTKCARNQYDQCLQEPFADSLAIISGAASFVFFVAACCGQRERLNEGFFQDADVEFGPENEDNNDLLSILVNEDRDRTLSQLRNS